MEKVKIGFYALLAVAIAVAVFWAIVKIAAVLSIIIMALVLGVIIYYTTKYWPRDRE